MCMTTTPQRILSLAVRVYQKQPPQSGAKDMSLYPRRKDASQRERCQLVRYEKSREGKSSANEQVSEVEHDDYSEAT